MKNYLTYLLVFCMLVYAGGYHLVYHLYQFGLKSEMKSYILNHKDTGLGERLFVATENGKISDRQFNWEEEGEEFTYGGVFYDVVSVTETDQGLNIVCLKDNAENKLENQIISIREKEHNTKKNASVSQFKFQPFCHSVDKPIFQLNSTTDALNRLYIHFAIPSRASEILLPPPRC